MDPYEVILHPIITEVSSRILETENKIVFAVSLTASKEAIKRAVEELYEVKVGKVTTLITSKGVKKAFVKLHPDYKAVDIAIKLGVI
jgi:large subunit ribosomal protein L23